MYPRPSPEDSFIGGLEERATRQLQLAETDSRQARAAARSSGRTLSGPPIRRPLHRSDRRSRYFQPIVGRIWIDVDSE